MTSSASSIWLGDPVILASKSRGRARLLESAGVPFDVVTSEIDERAIERSFAGPPADLAQALADAKASAVSRMHATRTVLAGDQVLAYRDEVLHKASSEEEAIQQLARLSGGAHKLHSAVSIMRDGEIVFRNVSSVTVRLLPLTRDALAAYARAAGRRMLETVGGYEIEGLGVNIIESLEGDFFTVVGLPLLPILAFFRSEGYIRGWESAS
ncbi:MAG: Maf family protein [Beijerinckiaceae bacterium]